jgi:hypothetical protein
MRIDHKNKTIIVVPGDAEPPVYIKEIRTKIGSIYTTQYWVIRDECWNQVQLRLQEQPE